MVEVDYVQDGVQVLVAEASRSHVLHRVWVDHLVPQCTHGHVWPGGNTHTDTHTLSTERSFINPQFLKFSGILRERKPRRRGCVCVQRSTSLTHLKNKCLRKTPIELLLFLLVYWILLQLPGASLIRCIKYLPLCRRESAESAAFKQLWVRLHLMVWIRVASTHFEG